MYSAVYRDQEGYSRISCHPKTSFLCDWIQENRSKMCIKSYEIIDLKDFEEQ